MESVARESCEGEVEEKLSYEVRDGEVLKRWRWNGGRRRDVYLFICLFTNLKMCNVTGFFFFSLSLFLISFRA